MTLDRSSEPETVKPATLADLAELDRQIHERQDRMYTQLLGQIDSAVEGAKNGIRSDMLQTLASQHREQSLSIKDMKREIASLQASVESLNDVIEVTETRRLRQEERTLLQREISSLKRSSSDSIDLRKQMRSMKKQSALWAAVAIGLVQGIIELVRKLH